MRSPFDNPGKRTVRESWNTPLLRFLNSEYGFRYRYMGLPGIELLDVQLWRDWVDEVVAFETRAKPSRKDKDGRRNVLALRTRMREYGLNGYAYFGSVEEVVILRRDQDGSPYTQNHLVTLYNLDFCDEISSPVETVKAGRQVWRFEAIRRILRDQEACHDPDSGAGYFLLLLTVRDQIGVNKLWEHFASPFADSSHYWELCQKSHPLPSRGFILGEHSWSLKTLIHDQLRKWFGNPNVSALFFPVTKYTGAPINFGTGEELPSPMLHMMVLCRFGDRTVSSPLFLPEKFLTRVSSVRAHNNGTLAWEPEPGEPTDMKGFPNSEAWFVQHRDKLITDPRTKLSRLP